MANKPSNISSCILWLLCLWFRSSDGYANITVPPLAMNTTLNSTVMFCCEAVSNNPNQLYIEFLINGVPVSQADHHDHAEGFSESTSPGVAFGTRIGTLKAIAYDYNNNTDISCRAIDQTLPVDLAAATDLDVSPNVTLYIQGLLDEVGNLNYTFINGFSIFLSWTAPYTLDNVPIIGYLVNGSEQTNTTNITLLTTNPGHCKLYTVSVSAINAVGIGSSTNISFYYPTVPLNIPDVSVLPRADEGRLSLIVKINVNDFCNSEYPDSITVTILNNEIKDSYSIPVEVDNEMMITGVVTIPNNLNTFTVNVSMSNKGGEFLPTPPFVFAKVGPVTNIESSSENCYFIKLTWNAPNSSSILGYNLTVYNNITGDIVRKEFLHSTTSYQFDDTELFIHRYTYVITGVNELGEGISREATFSYQRVPKSVNDTTVHFIKNYQDKALYKLIIPIKLECAREAPENATITILCNQTGVVYTNVSLVEYSFGLMNITRMVSVPGNQQCNITIVFSNGAGHSEPFILQFNTTPASSTSPTPSPTPTPSHPPISTKTRDIIIGCAIAAVLFIVALLASIIIGIICWKRWKTCKGKISF